MSESLGRVCRDSTTLLHDFMNASRRNGKCHRKRIDAHLQWHKKIFTQHFAGMNRAHSVDRTAHIFTSVVIDYLNISRAAIAPNEAHAELIVDADAVLAGSVTLERLQPVTRWRAQV